ncbi:hypothetical protein TWF191_001045 [Orbilia oligospora]|uniref:Uncharacterized protein n=1 Tax=Orbilia oligospora TaxID=2813651 RepID=A0A7C8UN64_ORBOL|nr:hypothetical protein TWF191_001045 [Orbilia oligospora]
MVFRPSQSSHHGRLKFFVTLLSLTTISVVVSSPVLQYTSRTGSDLSTSTPNVSKTLIYATTPTLLAKEPISGTPTYQPTGSKITAHIDYKHRTGQGVDTSNTTDKGAQISSVSSGQLVRSSSASTILTATATASLASTSTTGISDFGLETAPNNYKRVLSPTLFYSRGSLQVKCRGADELIETVIRPLFEDGLPPEIQSDIIFKWRLVANSFRRNYDAWKSRGDSHGLCKYMMRVLLACRKCFCDSAGRVIARGANNPYRTSSGALEAPASCLTPSRADLCSQFLGEMTHSKFSS